MSAFNEAPGSKRELLIGRIQYLTNLGFLLSLNSSDETRPQNEFSDLHICSCDSQHQLGAPPPASTCCLVFGEQQISASSCFLFPSAAAFVGFTAIILKPDVSQTLPVPSHPPSHPPTSFCPPIFLHLLFTFDLSLETRVFWTTLVPAAVVLGTAVGRVSCRDGGQTSVTPSCPEPDLPGL